MSGQAGQGESRWAARLRRLPLLALALLAPLIAEASVPRGGVGEAADASWNMASSRPPTELGTAIANSPFELFAGGELARALASDGYPPQPVTGTPGQAGGRARASLALASRVREERFHPFWGLALVGTEPLRGPPELGGDLRPDLDVISEDSLPGVQLVDPKTRIGGSGLFLGSRIGGEERLNLGLQWGYGPSGWELAEDQRKDPLGLLTWGEAWAFTKSAATTTAIGVGAVALGAGAVAVGAVSAPFLAGAVVVGGAVAVVNQAAKRYAAGHAETTGQALAMGFGDVSGVTSGVEAYTGSDVGTGRTLSGEERAERWGTVAGTAATVLAAPRVARTVDANLNFSDTGNAAAQGLNEGLAVPTGVSSPPLPPLTARPTFRLSEADYPNHVRMVKNAQQKGHSLRGHTRGAGTRAAEKNRYESQKPIRKTQGPPPQGFDYDEFPYASTQQGGAGAHVEPVVSTENQAAGRALGEFYRQNNIKPGDMFDVEILKNK